MHRPDGGDDRDVGSHPGAELGNLTGSVCSHLRDEDIGTFGEVFVHRPPSPAPLKLAGLATTVFDPERR